MSDPVRLLLVDDARVDLEMLRRLFESVDGIEVAAAVTDARAALDRLEEIDPDVIVTDLVMPGMGGRELVEEVMSTSPRPVLVVTSSFDDARVFRLLEAGALEVLPKPAPQTPEEREQAGVELARKVRMLADVPVFTRGRRAEDDQAAEPSRSRDGAGLVVIGASTGGPQALQTVLASLPATFPLPIVGVQHVSAEFTQGFVDWMNRTVDLQVRLADSDTVLEPGTVTLPKVDHHLELDGIDGVRSTQGDEEDGHRPSITTTMRSAAKVHGADAIGVLLTGMGKDGARGLEAIHRSGGTTVAQDEATSVVHGMPARAIELGVVDHVLGIDEIGPFLVRATRGSSR